MSVKTALRHALFNVAEKMAMLVDYASSGEEDGENELQTDSSAAIDYNDSSKVLSELKGKYSLDSAPGVPNKVVRTFGAQQLECRCSGIRDPQHLNLS